MRTIGDLDVGGRRVLVRTDLNVPLDGSRITDGRKIRACLRTLNALLDRGAAVLVCSHLGRPAGAPDPAYSLAAVATRLSQLLSRPVAIAADTVVPSARSAASALPPGDAPVRECQRKGIVKALLRTLAAVLAVIFTVTPRGARIFFVHGTVSARRYSYRTVRNAREIVLSHCYLPSSTVAVSVCADRQEVAW